MIDASINSREQLLASFPLNAWASHISYLMPEHTLEEQQAMPK